MLAKSNLSRWVQYNNNNNIKGTNTKLIIIIPLVQMKN